MAKARVVTDDEFYEHYGDWYLLEEEKDTIVAMLSVAVARFRSAGFSECVNVVEISWNLEGHFLQVSLLSNPDYYCYGQGPFEAGLCRRGNSVAFNTGFSVPSWAFLFKQTSPKMPAGPLLRVLDHQRVEIYGSALHDAVGQNLLRVVLESRKELFAGISFTDPHWLIVYFQEDGGEGKLVRVSQNSVIVHDSKDASLNREWFAEQSKL